MLRHFQELAADLASDGALRDFYILDVDVVHWNRLLQFVRPRLHKDCFRIDDRIEPLPPTFESIYAMRSTASPCLSIPIGESFLVCHFFSDSEIELDFRPEDYRSPQRWTSLCDFLQALVDQIGLPGIVTFENFQDEVIETFAPSGKVEPSAAPNGGPTSPLGNSGVTEGPPSVS
jgi:hypothetical protein